MLLDSEKCDATGIDSVKMRISSTVPCFLIRICYKNGLFHWPAGSNSAWFVSLELEFEPAGQSSSRPASESLLELFFSCNVFFEF
jgi:hypothetical protein